MIVTRELSKSFGAHRVLEDVNLRVGRGERVALLGLNGAGKTTFIRCLLGLTVFRGEVEIGGLSIQKQPRAARAQLGYVPQRAPHFGESLGEVVEFLSHLRGVDRDAVAAQMTRLQLSLEEHGSKPVKALSGGMLQKVLLAVALASEVPLLVLDEPTANLDPRARREFLRNLKRVNGETTILLASHRLSDVEAIADRLLVLHQGRIVFDGGMEDLWQRAGATETLWIQVPGSMRGSAEERITRGLELPTIIRNGSAMGVAVERSARADVLAELRNAGITVEDFWTEPPSLQEMLDHVLGDSEEVVG